MHHDSPKICPPWTLKATLYFNLKNGGMPLDPHYANPYQQTKPDQHTNKSKQNITIYLNFFSHRKLIQIQTQQNKTINYYQYPFKFTLSRMQLFIHQQHHNQISSLSLTLIFTMYLTLFVLFYFPWVLNLEDLYPKLNTLWFDFDLAKDNTSHNSILDIFSKKAILICWMTKHDKQISAYVNTSWNF